jgi:hypothetical protein
MERQALPEAAGVYAWWVRAEIMEAGAYPQGVGTRPLYLGATTNIAAAITADAQSVNNTNLRVGLAVVMAERLGLRPRTTLKRPLTKSEHERMNHWISANLLVSWSELPEPGAYHDALIRAFDPQLEP